MELLVPLISMAAIGLLALFWLWMFRDMLNNDYMPSNAKTNWTMLFVFLNVFAAVYYYVYVYRNR